MSNLPANCSCCWNFRQLAHSGKEASVRVLRALHRPGSAPQQLL